MLLTVDQFREHVTTSLPDAALQTLLNAAEAAILEVVGEPGEVTEYITARPTNDGYAPWGISPGYRRISVARPIASVTSVTDYRASGYVLQRIPDGTHPRWQWGQRVVVVYTPGDETADRERVQIELVRLDLNAQPGIALETIGTWEERYSGAGLLNYSAERADLLASLGSAASGGMVVVGE